MEEGVTEEEVMGVIAVVVETTGTAEEATEEVMADTAEVEVTADTAEVEVMEDMVEVEVTAEVEEAMEWIRRYLIHSIRDEIIIF